MARSSAPPPLTPRPASVPRPTARRLFLALDLPASVRAQLAACAGDLPGARRVAADQLHLTLRFLGSIPEADLEGLLRALGQVRAPRFELLLDGVGVFPLPAAGRAGPPRVLWAGIAPAAPVRALKQAIDQVLGPDPEAVGREFSPHVTLARFKERPGAALSAFLERERGLCCAPFPIDAFRLYESRTLPEGPQYSVLADFALPP